MKADTDNKVKVEYKGTLEDGQIFDQSKPESPLEFTIGDKQIIPAFEEAVIGMEINEQKTITLKPEQAYGLRNEDLLTQVKKADFPANIEPKVGLQLQVQSKAGENALVIISDISDDTISLDANHPLAGKTLNFDIKLLEIN